MKSYLQELDRLIAENKHKEASTNLLSLLKPGKKNVYLKTHRLASEMIAAKTPGSLKETGGKFLEFWKKLKAEESSMLTFLMQLEEAHQNMAELKWMKAIDKYRETIKKHHKNYEISKQKLHHFVKLCKNGILLEEQLTAAKVLAKNHQWKQAHEVYQKSLGFYSDELPFSIDEIKKQLNLCKKALDFEEHLINARHLAGKSMFLEALKFYNNASKLYDDSFGLNPQSLNNEVMYCKEAIQEKQERDTRRQGQLKFIAMVACFAVILIVVVGKMYYQPADFETNTEEVKSEKFYIAEKASTPEKEEYEPSKTILISNEEDAKKNDLIGKSISSPVEEINRASSNPNTYVFLENLPIELYQDEIDAYNRAYKVEVVDEIASIEEQIQHASHKLSHTAIIPFCNNSTETSAIYRDASFALRKMANTGIKPISKGAVQRALKRLNLQEGQLCDVHELRRLAVSLNVSQALVGEFTQLSNNQFKLSYNVLDIKTGQFSEGIELTSNNIQDLRTNLKAEIKTIFQ